MSARAKLESEPVRDGRESQIANRVVNDTYDSIVASLEKLNLGKRLEVAGAGGRRRFYLEEHALDRLHVARASFPFPLNRPGGFVSGERMFGREALRFEWINTSGAAEEVIIGKTPDESGYDRDAYFHRQTKKGEGTRVLEYCRGLLKEGDYPILSPVPMQRFGELFAMAKSVERSLREGVDRTPSTRLGFRSLLAKLGL